MLFPIQFPIQFGMATHLGVSAPESITPEQHELLGVGQLEAHAHVAQRRHAEPLELHIAERARDLD